MLVSDARPRDAVAWKLAFRNERRVMIFAIQQVRLRLRLLFLETREAHQQADHAANSPIIGGARISECRERRNRACVVGIEERNGRGAIQIEVRLALTRKQNPKE